MRAGVAEVAHRDSRGVYALLVHEVVTRVVRTRQADAHALGRITMSVNYDCGSRVTLEPQRYLVETRLVLVVYASRVDREEDRTTRRCNVDARSFCRPNADAGRAARTRARLVATRAISADVQRYADGAVRCRTGGVECNFATRRG